MFYRLLVCAIGGIVLVYIPIPKLIDYLVKVIIYFNKIFIKDLFNIKDEEDNIDIYILVYNYCLDFNIVKSLYIYFLYLRIRS